MCFVLFYSFPVSSLPFFFFFFGVCVCIYLFPSFSVSSFSLFPCMFCMSVCLIHFEDKGSLFALASKIKEERDK